MKTFKYIWDFKILAIVITILLFATTIISFYLPTVTSKIINVGIQQNGIENPASNYFSKESYDKIFKLCDDKDLLVHSYDFDENNNYYFLNTFGKNNIDKLNTTLTVPLVYIYDDNYKNINDDNQLKELYKRFNDNNEPGILKQKAISLCKIEQEHLGIDVNSNQINYLVKQGAFMLLLALITIIVSFVSQVLLSYVSMKIGQKKRKELFSAVMNFSNEELNKFQVSSLITRTTNDVQFVANTCTTVLSTILYAPVCIIVGFYFAFINAAPLSWIILLAAFAVFVGAIIFRKLVIELFRKNQKALDKVNLLTWEVISGIFDSRAFNKAKFENNRFDIASKKLLKLQTQTGYIMAFIPPIMALGTNFISLLVLFLGNEFIANGTLQVGNLVAFTTYSSLIISAFSMLAKFMVVLPKADVSINRIESIINCPLSIKNEIEKKDNILIDKNAIDNLSIKFDNVSFSYNNSENLTLKNISFNIKHGQTIGILGTVGSGKSTLLKLLLRLYDTTNGNIYFNNVNIKDIYLDDYRSLFAYAPQDSSLISGSIKENISWGIKDKNLMNNENYLYNFIDIAQASDFVKNKSEKGLNKCVSQGSTNISGGQRQRLSIARALAAKRPILVFDDCYSALDYKVEKNLKNAIKKLDKNFTKIIVSSRLSSIIDSDLIIVLENGKMVGVGTHKQLLKNCGEYIKIAHAQMDIDVKDN